MKEKNINLIHIIYLNIEHIAVGLVTSLELNKDVENVYQLYNH